MQWNDKSTRNSAYFQDTAGRLVNCWGDNESISLIESIFHNVTAFCLSKSTLFTRLWGVFTGFNGPTYSLCNCPSVLVRFYLAGASSHQLRNNSCTGSVSCFFQDWTKSQAIIWRKNWDLGSSYSTVYPVMNSQSWFEYYSHHPTKPFNSCDSRWGGA